MQPGEIVVARLGKGASIVQLLEAAADKVTVALGRNRQARIPSDRILIGTGVTASAQEEVEEFRRESEAISADIDLSEVWEVSSDEAAPIDLLGLADLYWDTQPRPAQIAALALHLDQNSDHFTYGSDGYTPLTRAAVEETQVRRRREAENAEAASSLMAALSQGSLPEPLSAGQEAVLDHLRSYAVYGDDYARSRTARNLLDALAEGAGDLQRRCFDLLVAAEVFSPDEFLELHRTGVREEFPEEALAEAATTAEPTLLMLSPRCRDLRESATFTIDHVGTDDRDDAISVEMDEAEPDGAYRIGIHITNVGALIPKGGAIDGEADQRMASLYLPERTVPMLPPEFSSRLGSLDPGEARLAMSLLVEVDSADEVSGWEITESVVRSRAAFTYEEADEALADEDSEWHPALKRLSRLAESRRGKRESDGAISIDRAEMAISVKPSGEVEVRVLERSSPARRLVTELMVLYNSLLAELCRADGLPAIYRAQDPPDLADVPPDPQNEAGRALWRHMVARRLAPAELSTTPGTHWGLGVPAYVQATSPLRRYPDLVIQRQIAQHLGWGKPLYSQEEVTSVLQRADVQLRELAWLEEGRRRYWFLKYLKQSRLDGPDRSDGPPLFEAYVLENEPGRLAILKLAEFPFRVRTRLGQTVAPGDTVTLELQGVDLWRRIGHFVVARNGAQG